jgi:ActD protein
MAALNSIYGLFPGPHAAERATYELRDAGVEPKDIIVMASEPFEEYSFAQGESSSAMPWIAVLGGLVGGTGGFLLAWYTQTAYPQPMITGGMPLVSPWPTGIITYELTMMGAIIATVITLLVSARLPNWKPALYDPAVSHGKVLIGVMEPRDDARDDLENRLRRAGAEEIKGTGRFGS